MSAADKGVEPTPPTLAQMTPSARAISLAYWGSGYAEGFAAGYAQCEADDAARWAVMRETIRQVAKSPDYATLAERRGQPERAAAQRALLVERGIA